MNALQERFGSSNINSLQFDSQDVMEHYMRLDGDENINSNAGYGSGRVGIAVHISSENGN